MGIPGNGMRSLPNCHISWSADHLGAARRDCRRRARITTSAPSSTKITLPEVPAQIGNENGNSDDAINRLSPPSFAI